MRPRNTLRLPARQTVILAREPKKILQKFELLLDDPEFREDVESLRSKWNIEPGQKKLVTSEMGDLESILNKHHLGNEWEYIIRTYITSGKFESMGDPHGIQVDFTKQMTYATIKIYPETTLKELRQAFSYLQRNWKSGKTSKSRPAPQADRDQFIMMLHAKHKSYKAIKDLVWENYDVWLDVGHLKAIVNKMKARKAKLR